MNTAFCPVVSLADVTRADLARVGGKNAALADFGTGRRTIVRAAMPLDSVRHVTHRMRPGVTVHETELD